ncbi:NADH:ubiquinone oxidoreductase subunit 5 (chain L)/Multisubunit Na+/H+ antiporter [Parelusimicrobium proximum]|uniref:proton-conducting transporter transmembrane domain-containing protein n=1 Tax=Parelusimicrobium proximum TaxID=3228953 RepID=UPI003D17D99E
MNILVPVFSPLFAAALVLILGKKNTVLSKIITFAAPLVSLTALFTLMGENAFYSRAFTGLGFNFTLSLDSFSYAIALFINIFALLALIYSQSDEDKSPLFYFNFLYTLAFACGAVLADNIILMLFFWEGLLVSLYLFLLFSKGEEAPQTAFRAFIINIAGDILLMAGVVIVILTSGAVSISETAGEPLTILEWKNQVAFVCFILGAAAKAGAVPFQSWLPMAAKNASTSFMALLPGALEKLLAVYLLGRVYTMFANTEFINISDILIIIALLSIIPFAVMMIFERSLKKFVVYNVIVQIGLVLLELAASGHAHLDALANHGIYKAAALTALFFCAGNIYTMSGTDDMSKMGGLAKGCKVTLVTFILASLSLCGVTALDILFSHTVYGLELNHVFLIAVTAIAFVFITVAFIQNFILIFTGKGTAKEAPALSAVSATAVIGLIVLLCQIGWTWQPYNIFNLSHAHLEFSGAGIVTLAVLLVSVIFFFIGKRKNGLDKASLIMTKLPLVSKAENLYNNNFDLYNVFKKGALAVSGVLYKLDRFMDFAIDDIPRLVAKKVSKVGSGFHTGYNADYILWALLGAAAFAVLALSGGLF